MVPGLIKYTDRDLEQNLFRRNDLRGARDGSPGIIDLNTEVP
jgi:hypothetical protein